MGRPGVNMMGERYGKLLVLRRAPERRHRQFVWVCLCDCGRTVKVKGHNLRSHKTRSCGCLLKETNGGTVTHGLWKHPIYQIYQNMIQRCYNPRHSSYHNYGGRGIAVCDRWREGGVEIFAVDMGSRPEGTSLDRKDNEGDYEPGNCRWATNIEQRRNQRRWRNIGGENVLGY